MKKFLLILLLLFWAIPANAKGKNYLYTAKNATPIQVINAVALKLNSIQTDKDNCLIYSIDNQYFIKAYAVDSNTELYLYADTKQIEELNNIIKSTKYRTFNYNDKYTLKKYYSDFLAYIKNNNIPITNIKSKQLNNKEYNNYTPYSKKIKNKVIATITISEQGIQIIRNQYKPKYKVKKKANEYEYIIKNNTGKNIIINKVASNEFIGLTQIASYCLIPQWQDFIPLYGLIYGIQTDIEKNKFTRPHPINEIIKVGASIRILALSKPQDNPTADFYFTIDNKKTFIQFNPEKGVQVK